MKIAVGGTRTHSWGSSRKIQAVREMVADMPLSASLGVRGILVSMAKVNKKGRTQ